MVEMALVMPGLRAYHRQHGDVVIFPHVAQADAPVQVKQRRGPQRHV
jgi:hypothetical protein